MSASLANTVSLLADNTFRAKVQAAMVEQAMLAANDTNGPFAVRSAKAALAMQIITDPEAYVRVFAPLCADDSVISAVATAVDVAEADIRRVVSTLWASVAAALPNLR